MNHLKNKKTSSKELGHQFENSWNTVTTTHYGIGDKYSPMTTGTASAGTYTTVSSSPRLKSTTELLLEREERVLEIAVEFENMLADKMPDATKEEVRQLAKDITSVIYDKAVVEALNNKGYTVTL